VGGRKRRSAPGPAKKGWRPERWQTFLAAAVAAIATLGVPLITTFGGSSTGGSGSNASVSGGDPVAAAPASEGSAAAVAPAAAQSSQLTIAITSFTSVSWPPPPGEDYSFRGVISNLSSLGGVPLTGGLATHFEVYVIACGPAGNESDTNGSNCLESPAGHLSDNGAWYVNNWHIRDPLKNAQWAAMITETSTGNVRGCIPSPPPPPTSTPADFKAFAYNLVKQAQCSFGIDAFSKPVSSR
jgi:hypothetical protein